METESQRKMLAPGVTLCAIRTSRFKTGRISVNMAMPLQAETAAQYALLPYLLRRTCEKYPDFSQLNSRLAELYGAILSARVEKQGEAQVLRLSISSIDDRFALTDESIGADCAQLLCELLFRPLLREDCFCEAQVEQEKRLLTERIESELNDKRAYALHRCEALMCADEAYGVSRYGTVEQVQAITARQITDAWRAVLASARIQINVVGSMALSQVEERFRMDFGAVGRKTPVEIQTRFVPRAGEVRRVEEKLALSQGKLVLGFRSGMENAGDDLFAMRVMADLYGGGPYSRLFTNVREKLSLCYYCSARLYRLKGVLLVQSGVEAENSEKAEKEILNQLSVMQSASFEDAELEASRAGLSDALLTVGDMPSDLDDWYAQQMLEEQPLSPEEFAQGVRGVTRGQVCAAAKRVSLDTVYLLSGTGEGEAQ